MAPTHPRLNITGIGTAPVAAMVETRRLTGGERLRRAAMGPVLGLGVASLVLPIPIVHLIVPPLALVGGVAFGVWRLPQQELFVSLRGPCPCCGVEQSYGLCGVVYRLPQSLKCHACLQLLTLAEASGSAPDRTMNPQR